jgi:very-short-patch-repair endonuclease
MKIFNGKLQKSLRQKLRNESPQAEQVLWNYLRKRQVEGFKFRRQTSIDHYIVDFYCPKAKLVVEIDGDTHFEPAAELSDNEREKYITSLGIKVLRFTNLDVYQNIDEVIKTVMKALPK